MLKNTPVPISERKPASFEEGLYRQIFHVAVDGLLISDVESGLVVAANPATCRMLGYASEELIGQPLASLIHPDSRHDFNELIRHFRLGQELDTWTRDARRSGSARYTRWRAGPFDFQGRRSLLWCIRDISERIQAEQALRQHMKSRSREQTALLEATHALASTLEFPPGMILEQLREVIPYDRGAIFWMDGGVLSTLAMRGTAELERAVPLQIPLQDSDVASLLFPARAPVRIGEMLSTSRRAVLLRSVLTGEDAALVSGMHSWMWVPLPLSTGMLGGFGVASRKSRFYTARHAGLALQIAEQAVTMMVNAELYKQGQQIAAMQERQRLAQNLHDAVNQSLFSAGLIAEVLPRIWDQEPELARQSLEELNRLTRGAMAEMRALLAELRPSTLTDAELGDLLRLLANALSGRLNLPVRLNVIGSGSLPPDLQVTIYRICQEAMNNIAKHAGAKQVDISLCHDGRGIDLKICDDGRGFDPRTKFVGHYGLSMMRERAEAAECDLTITSQPGHGTELRIRWPKNHH